MGKDATKKASSAVPSSNWLALKKTISSGKTSGHKEGHAKDSGNVPPRKRRRIASEVDVPVARTASTSARTPSPPPTDVVESGEGDDKNGESLSYLRRMILGKLESTYKEAQRSPGKYIALDCEMVGVGIDGKESSLARVSLVNYHGVVLMDEFVRQRERVVDYRTEFSGIRPSDMAKAKPFVEVQKQVADLIKDRILIGHAIFNDLKALLLSHPGPLTRDTQRLAAKHQVTKSKYPALRHLVQQEVGVAIQGGEHSSVTDARATMAIFRIHKKEWEKSQRPMTANVRQNETSAKKSDLMDDDDRETTSHGASADTASNVKKGKRKRNEKEGGSGLFPGGGRKGVSSGKSVVIRRRGDVVDERGRQKGSAAGHGGRKAAGNWWADLGSGV
ncbi:hypothetical protein PUNSTDRAFT_105720 [Punctularia strigosozonata HHB-11173 SS5]|uniref:uncharacterized protein n=1 Tax=Punctularia strigosozonata (strain HHB-11173) TaxID=741275 RepID=UPI0004417C8D|nr:uncharacterized protein PUNSTDRAFT_105720 [Punctularia strigosozonata HHB-11173 SS5]EIN06614.1 hypothetical protein PUNSTDRAFT_105720 [Punctularia strigosozonata HHB-11173 SS5]